MGSDLIHVRELAARAARQEYAVVFLIFSTARFSAKHRRTFALPSRVVWDPLDATVEEIGRNGFKDLDIMVRWKPELLRFFIQSYRTASRLCRLLRSPLTRVRAESCSARNPTPRLTCTRVRTKRRCCTCGPTSCKWGGPRRVWGRPESVVTARPLQCHLVVHGFRITITRGRRLKELGWRSQITASAFRYTCYSRRVTILGIFDGF